MNSPSRRSRALTLSSHLLSDMLQSHLPRQGVAFDTTPSPTRERVSSAANIRAIPMLNISSQTRGRGMTTVDRVSWFYYRLRATFPPGSSASGVLRILILSVSRSRPTKFCYAEVIPALASNYCLLRRSKIAARTSKCLYASVPAGHLIFRF